MVHSSTHQAAAVELLTAQVSTTVVSHVVCSEVQEQEPVHGGAGGPRQRLHHTRNIRPGAAFLDRTWSSVYTLQPGLAWYLHWRWVSKYTHTHTHEFSAVSHWICFRKTALEHRGLRDLRITHVLNAAEGKWNNVLTGADYYSDMNIRYYGIEADDKPTFNISQFFHPAAQFIHEALSQPQSESEQVKDV